MWTGRMPTYILIGWLKNKGNIFPPIFLWMGRRGYCIVTLKHCKNGLGILDSASAKEAQGGENSKIGCFGNALPWQKIL